MSFEEWMREIDSCLEALCGLGHMDLPDYMYRDAFDDSLDPAEVAQDVMDNCIDFC